MTKSVISWPDTPNKQQCGMYDNDDNGVRNDSSAVQDAFGTTRPVSRNIALTSLVRDWVGVLRLLT